MILSVFIVNCGLKDASKVGPADSNLRPSDYESPEHTKSIYYDYVVISASRPGRALRK
jgi:hypothetical protein